MQAEAIVMAGINFVVAKNQDPTSPTLFLDILSVLQVAYLHGTGQRTQLADEKSASLVCYASVLEAGIATSYI
jgi:hypothetical protein